MPTNISKLTTVSEHFFADHHTANDISLIPLELVHSNGDAYAKLEKMISDHKTQRASAFGCNKKRWNVYYFLIIFYILYIFLLKLNRNSFRRSVCNNLMKKGMQCLSLKLFYKIMPCFSHWHLKKYCWSVPSQVFVASGPRCTYL